MTIYHISNILDSDNILQLMVLWGPYTMVVPMHMYEWGPPLSYARFVRESYTEDLEDLFPDNTYYHFCKMCESKKNK